MVRDLRTTEWSLRGFIVVVRCGGAAAADVRLA
jgi:hypothetical protein